MPGAVARPSKGGGGSGGGPPQHEDAFVRALNRFIAWARENTGVLILAGVVLVVVVGGAFYWRSYRQNLEERAASELASLRSRIARGADTAVAGSLQGFLGRFGDTEAAREARILLTQQHLVQGRPSEAVEAVRPVASRHAPDTPGGYAGRQLLAEAQVAAGDTAAALSTLEELSERARFPFQRHEAAAERASLLAASGRLEEARAIYSRLVEEASGSEAGNLYAVRLGEVEARLAAGTGGNAGPSAESAADTAAAGG